MLLEVVGEPVQRVGWLRLTGASPVFDQRAGQPPVQLGELVKGSDVPIGAADLAPLVVVEVAGRGVAQQRFGQVKAVAEAAGIHRGP
ncbi:hypothetical protein FXF69_00775 [Actinomadura chibensis]|uniref:Uncharacterized protein n=1 Tax=Actinomadura chibensis TaxID=392828 RepID=A0A5D0NUF4_9ACTN|nr:hypothetical protein FXF69_00775 [Actinomadura chibensis]